MLCGPLLPRNGASSECGWKRRPQNMEVSSEYVDINTMLTESLVTVAWHTLRLWMEETGSRYRGSMAPRNVGILLQCYTSQPKRPRLES